MSKDTWDAILASAPINATAARVTSKGDHFDDIGRTYNERHWGAPPKMKRVVTGIDLTGVKIGRLTVIGLLDIPQQKQGAVWVCRCACGDYCDRKAKALQQPKHPEAMMCQRCDYTNIIRKRGERAKERAEAPEARKW